MPFHKSALAVSFVACAVACLAATTSIVADAITAAQAAQHVGEVQTVHGVVASATYASGTKGQPTFLNLDKPYPETIFTVVIWGSDRGKFTTPPEKAFSGLTVRVTGEITAYRGTPEIVVYDPSQIIMDNTPQGLPEQATPINPPSGTMAMGPEATLSIDARLDGLRAKAEKGDAEAQLLLAFAYYDKGDGVPRDIAEAVKWLRNAAEQGYAAAQYALGNACYNGHGVPKDGTEAVNWFRKAAEQGYAPAQRILGRMYCTGDGVPKEPAEAVKWLRKAADQGDADAQAGLGVMYKEGDGVAKNPTEAVKWLKKAAEQGDSRALRLLAMDWGLDSLPSRNSKLGEAELAEAVRLFRVIAVEGDGWAQNWLADAYSQGVGVAKDDVAAVEWWRKAAMNEVVWAKEKLAESCFLGRGVQKDHAEALIWYRAANKEIMSRKPVELGLDYFPSKPDKNDQPTIADQNDAIRKRAEGGDAGSQWSLGENLAKGDGVAQDGIEAIKWIRKAAEQGHAKAQFCLGLAYDIGSLGEHVQTGLKEDAEEAARWYRKSAEQGDTNAQLAIGRLCYSGRGTTQDFVEATKWFQKAAEQNNAHAQMLCGLACAFGDGVEENDVAAVKWLRKAANRHNQDAVEALRDLFNIGAGFADEDVE